MITYETIKKANDRACAFLNERKIANLIIKNFTHSRMGGYNTKTRSLVLGDYFEYPREQSIKGIWRWWLRILLSSTGLDEKEIPKKVDEILGSIENPSKYRFTISSTIIKNPQYMANPEIVDDRSLKKELPARMSLFITSKDDSRTKKELISVYEPGSLQIRIDLYSKNSVSNQLEQDLNILILYSLVIAIIFSGLGSITKRGFGRFSIENITTFPNGNSVIRDIDLIKNSISKTDLDLENALRNIIDNSVKLAEKIGGSKKSTELQNYSSFDLKNRSKFRIKVVTLKNVYNSKDALKKIGLATLKFNLKKVPGNRINLDTWILGLPRYQKTNELTGYVTEEEYNQQTYGSQRRSSSILFIPFVSHDGNIWKCAIMAFKSLDWPDKLIHKSGNLQQRYNDIRNKPPLQYIDVKRKLNDNSYDVFTNVFDSIIKLLEERDNINNYRNNYYRGRR